MNVQQDEQSPGPDQILPPLTNEQRQAIELLAQFDKQQLQKWKQYLAMAQDRVKYWETQTNASSLTALRITMSQWKDQQ